DVEPTIDAGPMGVVRAVGVDQPGANVQLLRSEGTHVGARKRLPLFTRQRTCGGQDQEERAARGSPDSWGRELRHGWLVWPRHYLRTARTVSDLRAPSAAVSSSMRTVLCAP